MKFGSRKISITQRSTSTGQIKDILKNMFAANTNSCQFVSQESSFLFHLNDLIVVTNLTFIVGIMIYFITWLTRKKISLLKLLGEKSMTGWENVCQESELGQAPAINFVSSCIITNDRVFITLRVMLAVWSLVLTVYTFAGNRSVFFGTYYPLAAYITIYVSRHRQVVQKTKSQL